MDFILVTGARLLGIFLFGFLPLTIFEKTVSGGERGVTDPTPVPTTIAMLCLLGFSWFFVLPWFWTTGAHNVIAWHQNRGNEQHAEQVEEEESIAIDPTPQATAQVPPTEIPVQPIANTSDANPIATITPQPALEVLVDNTALGCQGDQTTKLHNNSFELSVTNVARNDMQLIVEVEVTSLVADAWWTNDQSKIDQIFLIDGEEKFEAQTLEGIPNEDVPNLKEGESKSGIITFVAPSNQEVQFYYLDSRSTNHINIDLANCHQTRGTFLNTSTIMD